MKDCSKKKIAICTFFDEGIASFFIPHYNSLKCFSESNFEYFVGLTDAAYKILEDFILMNKIQFKIINSSFKDNNHISISMPNHVSNLTFLRFKIFNFFDNLNDYDTVIYFDIDMLAISPFELCDYISENENFVFKNNNSIENLEKTVISWRKTLKDSFL